MAAAASGDGRRRLVVVGGSGLVGRHLVAAARRSGRRCLATYHRHPVAGGVRFDMAADRLPERLPGLGPGDAVVLLGAHVDQAWVDANAAAARALNVDATWRCANDVVDAGARLVFMSSEAVFAGDRENGYDEEASPSPVSRYGELKAEVESRLRSLDAAVGIARAGWIVAADECRRCPVRRTYAALLGGGARMATDNLLTLTDIADVVAGLLGLAGIGAGGVFHLSANPPVGRSELADQVIADSARGPEMRYRPVRFADLPRGPARPRAAWLDSRRTRARLGLRFRHPHEVIRRKTAVLDRMPALD